jgi:2-polyprenyl-6-methoxyphenol hydroxylase-like FAD-dependent oxidoreductase
MTKVVVVGAGPIGLYCAIVSARQGNEVVVVDRDGGPASDGTWQRRGVMQFHHPHFFRHLVFQTLTDGAPDAWDAVVAAGANAVQMPGAPDFIKNLQCRRTTFEAALRSIATAQPGLELRTGHAEQVAVEGGRATGVFVDGELVRADLVIAASGRAGRFGDDLRAPGEGGGCGFSYVSRMYRVVDDEAAATLAASPVPLGKLYDGYLVIVFPQDARTLSTLIVRASDDEGLAAVRHEIAWDAAMRSVPHLAEWTEPGRFEPISDVMPGGGLTNTYRRQSEVAGLFFVGDAVCTTNPMAGRGISLGLMQAQHLLRLIDEDVETAAAKLELWCDEHVKPWYDDHVYWDATLLRRFKGGGIDLDARIPSDVICAAAEVDPEITPVVLPYLAMLAAPAALRPMEERARAVLRTGWRPPLALGPTRDELVELIGTSALSAAR